MHVASGVVIGIKKIGVLGNFRAVISQPDFEDERLEKPTGVR